MKNSGVELRIKTRTCATAEVPPRSFTNFTTLVRTERSLFVFLVKGLSFVRFIDLFDSCEYVSLNIKLADCQKGIIIRKRVNWMLLQL